MAKQLVFIMGAGGHAKMVIEALVSMHHYELYGCLDTVDKGERLLGYPVFLESEDTLSKLSQAKALALVALGENRLRERISLQLADRGFDFATAISHRAYVSPSASIGPGTVVMPGAVVGAMARIGRGVILNTASSVDHDTIVDDFAHIAPGCHVAGNVTIETGAMLGIGTCVIPERRIGAWSILGANSTVVRDIPSGATCVGTPARPSSSASPRATEP